MKRFLNMFFVFSLIITCSIVWAEDELEIPYISSDSKNRPNISLQENEKIKD